MLSKYNYVGINYIGQSVGRHWAQIVCCTVAALLLCRAAPVANLCAPEIVCCQRASHFSEFSLTPLSSPHWRVSVAAMRGSWPISQLSHSHSTHTHTYSQTRTPPHRQTYSGPQRIRPKVFGIRTPTVRGLIIINGHISHDFGWLLIRPRATDLDKERATRDRQLVKQARAKQSVGKHLFGQLGQLALSY